MNAPAEYRVEARNLSEASENRIHADDVARRFGFRGGLVPGVEVYAYMAHLPVARWGAEWLERGSAECRFVKPVYDGKVATARAEASDGTLAIVVESEGEKCATGSASLEVFLDSRVRGNDEGNVTPAKAGVRETLYRTVAPPPAPDERPDADETTLPVGRHLSSHPMHFPAGRLEQYLADIRETEPLYAREQLVHPAFMLRLSNSALKDNVKLSAWIHTGSVIRHCGLARAGDTLQAHAVVAANYERKGHRFVDLDVVIVADGKRPVAEVRHTAIYHLRQS